jgi:hypothetical protein
VLRVRFELREHRLNVGRLRLRVLVGDVADMQDDVDSCTSSSVARKASTSSVGRSEIKPTVSERIAGRPLGRFTVRSVGSSVANSMSSAITADCVRR